MSEGEGESGAAIRRKSFNIGDYYFADAGRPWSQDDQEDDQQYQKEKQEIQDLTHKKGLFTAFERGEKESSSNQKAGFWCVRNF